MCTAFQFSLALLFAKIFIQVVALPSSHKRSVSDANSRFGTTATLSSSEAEVKRGGNQGTQKVQTVLQPNREDKRALSQDVWTSRDFWRSPRSNLHRLAVHFGLIGKQAVQSPEGLSLTEWASQTLPGIPVLSDNKSLKPLDHVLEQNLAMADGLFLEFGVFSGESIKKIAAHVPDGQRVFGFDSFSGLPEDFKLASGDVISKRVFDVQGHLPEVPSNVELVKGWFNETLPSFLQRRPNVPVSLLHIDSDLYSSAKYVLDAMSDRIRPGTIIVFDELINYPNYHEEELRALYESLSDGGSLSEHQTEWIGSMCPVKLIPSAEPTDWGPCCAVALRVVT